MMDPEVAMRVLPTFYDFLWEVRATEKALYGGAASGKTTALIQYIVDRALQPEEADKQSLIVMETRPGNLKAMFYPICDLLEYLGVSFESRETAPAHITPITGHRIWFTSTDKQEKMKHWDNISRIAINEATALTDKEFEHLMNRVGRVTDAEVIFTFNPIDEQHWLCKDYVLKFLNNTLPPDVAVHHSTYKDNRFLKPKYCEWLEGRLALDPNFYRVYALGLPGHLEGLVYQEGTNWTQSPFASWPELVRKYPPKVIGMDWGVTDPTAAVAVWEYKDVRYVHNFIYSPHMTPTDVCTDMESVFNQMKWPKQMSITGDPAGAAYILDMQRRGWNIHKAEHDVLYGISQVKDKPIVISEESIDMIKELRNYRWKEKDGAFKDEPVKNMDHSLDALRYAICLFAKGVGGTDRFIVMAKRRTW